MASQLFSQEGASTNVEYFGALTLAVQINTGRNDNTWQLLKFNLFHLARLARAFIGDPRANQHRMFVIKKLMSNAARIFFQLHDPKHQENSITWKNPLETFLLLTSQEGVRPEVMDNFLQHILAENVPYDNLIQVVNSSTAFNTLLLLFSEVIIEDLIKFQATKVGSSHLHNAVREHLYISSMSIVNYNLQQLSASFQTRPHETPEVADTVFRCVRAWIEYATMARSGSQGHLDLTENFENLIHLMCLHNPDFGFPYSETIVSILGEIFGTDPTILNYELRTTLEGVFLGVGRTAQNKSEGHEWMLQYMNHLVVNQMFDDLKDLALCVVDFLQVSNLDVCNKLFTVASDTGSGNLDQYIKVLLQMTNFTLVPVLEEFFSVRMVDFWLDLCDGYNNLVRETLKPETPELAANIFGQVAQIYLPKINLQNKQKIIREGEEDSLLHEFDDFRGAVLDLIESMWSVLGHEKLTDILVYSIGQIAPSSAEDLFQVEAMCFCLNKLLADMNLAESPSVCESLRNSKGFLANVLLLIQTSCQQKDASNGREAQILSSDFIKTGSSMLATVSDYFKRDEAELRNCMDTLFSSLETCSNKDAVDTKFELLITKCTTSICEKSRLELGSYLPTFTKIQHAMIQPSSNVSSFSKQGFTRCLGYIIQAYTRDGPEAQAQYLLQVINSIKSEVVNANNDRDQILCLLSCLSELGSAFIQSDEFEDPAYLSQLSHFQTFWQEDPLHLRVQILDMLESILALHGKDPEFIEVACLIMGKKLNVSDDEPHFLGYSMHELMDFLLRRCDTCEPSSGLSFIIYLLEKVVIQYRSSLSPQDFNFMLSSFFLEKHRDAVSADPDLTQLMVTFVNSVMDSRPGLAVHCEQWAVFLLPEFMRLLSSKERFTISAVTKFWTKVINNKKYTRHDEVTVREQIFGLGLELTNGTMSALLSAQRSELNFYSDLLRALIARYPLQSKQWLLQTLPLLCENHRAHQLLVEKLFVTRGSRAAANAVLEWWLSCNGLPQLT